MAWASVSGVVGSCCESLQCLLIEGHGLLMRAALDGLLSCLP